MTTVVVVHAQRLGRILGCLSQKKPPPRQLATGLAPQWEDLEHAPPSFLAVTQVIVPSTRTSPGGCWKKYWGENNSLSPKENKGKLDKQTKPNKQGMATVGGAQHTCLSTQHALRTLCWPAFWTQG